MRYTLQVNTGTLTRTAGEGTDIAARLAHCLDKIDVERVIYGWSPDPAINESVAEFLTRRGIEKYVWLPVFSEIHDPGRADPFVSISGGGNRAIETACDGESFDFVCQCSAKNIDRAKAVYERIAGDQAVEGVFLDRIRYASAANSADDLFGCWCPRCRARYEAQGIDGRRFAGLRDEQKKWLFVPKSMEDGRYHYEDEDIEKLAAARRSVISEAVDELCSHFRKKGKKIGVDTFAPGFSDFVGQDLTALGRMADFIKPMVYLRTSAPAGVPYELDALGSVVQKRIGELWRAPAAGMDAAILQIEALMRQGVNVAPGIDVNQIPGICSATPEYVAEYLGRLREIGCESVVLAWDALNISEDVLAAVAAVK